MTIFDYNLHIAGKIEKKDQTIPIDITVSKSEEQFSDEDMHDALRMQSLELGDHYKLKISGKIFLGGVEVPIDIEVSK